MLFAESLSITSWHVSLAIFWQQRVSKSISTMVFAQLLPIWHHNLIFELMALMFPKPMTANDKRTQHIIADGKIQDLSNKLNLLKCDHALINEIWNLQNVKNWTFSPLQLINLFKYGSTYMRHWTTSSLVQITGRCQNQCWLLKRSHKNTFQWNLIQSHTLRFKEIHLTMICAKCRPFCPALNMLKD